MISPTLLAELKALLGAGAVCSDPGELIAYSYDSQPKNALPGAVVTVRETGQVAAVVRLASRFDVPVVARGAGSGMTGGSVPERGGLVLNFERMKRILSIDEDDRTMVVEPGVITGDLQEEAARHGLYYPPEPASALFSSIGGNIAESAGGLGCVRYGLAKHFVTGLEFVTAAGDIVRTGVLSDSAAPFDVGAAVVGSEGTLAVVTTIALRLIPLPVSRATVTAFFRTLDEAARASNTVLQSGIGPSVLEFMDDTSLATVRDYAGGDIPDGAGALLIVETEGETPDTEHDLGAVVTLLERAGAFETRTARSAGDRERLWKLRKSLSPAIARIAPLKYNEDVCVPLSKIPDLCRYVEELGRRNDVRVVSFGHSGDGNVHVNFMTHWERPDEVERSERSVGELFSEVVRMGGTLSGEHGIGLAKRPYLDLALDAATVAFEKKIKAAFDPGGMLNPGKIFP